MKVFAFACIIFAVCISTSLQWTPYDHCVEEITPLPVPISLNIEGCHSFPCEFIGRTNLTAQLIFAAQTNANSLKTQVNLNTNTGVYAWAPDTNACKSLSKGRCPLRTGEIATYDINMPLFTLIPQYTPSFYQFKLLDGNNRVQACFRLCSKFVRLLPLARRL